MSESMMWPVEITSIANHNANASSIAGGTRVGTAGWSIPRALADDLPSVGSHLARYARVLKCVEINTSFSRSHRQETYARWAMQTPPDFRFAVKMPRTITHELRLRGARGPLERFLEEVSGLGDRLGVVLVQLPPSLLFEAKPVRSFFDLLASRFGGPVVCEPRHATWFEPEADRLLSNMRIARVATDPAAGPVACIPGGWLGPGGDGAGATIYHRWHGSPQIYYSSYSNDWMHVQLDGLKHWSEAANIWCIFDNTASGAALSNALTLRDLF